VPPKANPGCTLNARQRSNELQNSKAGSLVITTAAHPAGLRSAPAGWAPCRTSGKPVGQNAAEPGDQSRRGRASARAFGRERKAKQGCKRIQAKQERFGEDLGEKPINGKLLTWDHVRSVAEGRRECRWWSRLDRWSASVRVTRLVGDRLQPLQPRKSHEAQRGLTRRCFRTGACSPAKAGAGLWL